MNTFHIYIILTLSIMPRSEQSLTNFCRDDRIITNLITLGSNIWTKNKTIPKTKFAKYTKRLWIEFLELCHKADIKA